jgi:hypothetical protein
MDLLQNRKRIVLIGVVLIILVSIAGIVLAVTDANEGSCYKENPGDDYEICEAAPTKAYEGAE